MRFSRAFASGPEPAGNRYFWQVATGSVKVGRRFRWVRDVTLKHGLPRPAEPSRLPIAPLGSPRARSMVAIKEPDYQPSTSVLGNRSRGDGLVRAGTRGEAAADEPAAAAPAAGPARRIVRGNVRTPVECPRPDAA
jgi:hypothetical protein